MREKGNLNKGVKLENGGTLRIELNYRNVKIPDSWDDSNNDNRILKLCKGLQEDKENVFSVTKDIFVRIKADILGITAQDFFAEQVPEYEKQYRGRQEVYTTKEKLDDFYSKGYMNKDDIYVYTSGYTEKVIPELTVNEFLLIHSETNEKTNCIRTL